MTLKVTITLTYIQVNVPKTRKTYCKGKSCKKHTFVLLSSFENAMEVLTNGQAAQGDPVQGWQGTGENFAV